jgi:hypothetical protein
VSEVRITPFERFDLRFEPRRWEFADANRAAIDARFAARQRANPALWNGRVLLAHRYEVADGVCRGAFLETDFASFSAWRDWGRPPAGIANCFPAAVVRGSDGGFLLGVMADHTANAGQCYFPCGTPEPGDVIDGRVDLEFNARHELLDETGLPFDELQPELHWTSVQMASWSMTAKVLHAAEPAEAVRLRILRHLAGQSRPELCDIRVVRGPADLDGSMPPFVSAFLDHIWSQFGYCGPGRRSAR